MSLEIKIEALTAAIESLNRNICQGMIPMMTKQSLDVIEKGMNVAPAAPVAQVVAPVAAPAPVVAAAPVAAPAPVMPAAPSFAPVEAAAPAPVGGAPFTDGKGLIDYVMSAYKALGPQKGASIQAVLTQLGYANINDVKPEHYGSLFAGIEALKG